MVSTEVLAWEIAVTFTDCYFLTTSILFAAMKAVAFPYLSYGALVVTLLVVLTYKTAEVFLIDGTYT